MSCELHQEIITLEEIQDRIALLHGRNRNLINEIKKDPNWQSDKKKATVMHWLESISDQYYQASLFRGL